MTADFAHSTYAEEARTAKAIRLETQLSADGIPSAAARTLPPASRRRIEKAAGVNRASDETWERAIAFLADYERSREMQREAHQER